MRLLNYLGKAISSSYNALLGRDKTPSTRETTPHQTRTPGYLSSGYQGKTIDQLTQEDRERINNAYVGAFVNHKGTNGYLEHILKEKKDDEVLDIAGKHQEKILLNKRLKESEQSHTKYSGSTPGYLRAASKTVAEITNEEKTVIRNVYRESSQAAKYAREAKEITEGSNFMKDPYANPVLAQQPVPVYVSKFPTSEIPEVVIPLQRTQETTPSSKSPQKSREEILAELLRNSAAKRYSDTRRQTNRFTKAKLAQDDKSHQTAPSLEHALTE